MGYYTFKQEDVYAFARHVHAETKIAGDEMFFKTCPYCKPKPTKDNIRTFSINLSTGQFKCFRASCGASGNMLQLARDFDFSLGTEVDEYYTPKKRYRALPQPKTKIIPKSKAIEYLNSRGITDEIAKEYEITTRKDATNIMVFPFFDEKSKLQFIKYRKIDFDKEKDTCKEWCEPNCKPILFGMKQCDLTIKRLVICEGMIDSLSVATAGIKNAVSVPTGAKGMTWVPHCYDFVSSFKEIVVFGDYEKGHISLLEDIQKRFKCQIKHVREQDYKDCKDANELLQKYGVSYVNYCVENAVPISIKHVINLADVESKDVYKLPKLKTGIKQLDNLLYGGIPFGMVTVLAGKRGQGKSVFASQICANAIEQGYTVFAYSGELPNHLFKSIVDFQIAGKNHITENQSQLGYVDRFITNSNQALIDDWYRDMFYLYDTDAIEDEETTDLFALIEKTVLQYGAKVILIDNLMTAMYMDDDNNNDEFSKQGKFVRKLASLAMRFDLVIILVAHKRKTGIMSRDMNDEVSGSSKITDLAGLTLSYERSDDLNESQRKLIVAKNRLFGKVNFEGFTLDYEEKSKRIYGEGDNENFEFGWNKRDIGLEGLYQILSDEDTPF